MKIVSIREVKTDLTRLIEKACMGEQIIIARGKDRIVRLVPVRER
mgnify:CR=1 FL=1